jgi:hypothetical protein
MVDMPIASADVPRADAILITYTDNDQRRDGASS